MTGNRRCQGRKKMMGRGADGGCGTEEKTCPVSRLTPAAKSPAPAVFPAKVEPCRLGVDLYTQACKALSERSPFDSDEVLATTAPTLPSGLASLLSKHSDSRKKHKRHHSDAKSSRKGSNEKSKGSNIWVELEEYFRELTLQDIERLYQLSSLFGYLDSDNSCFTIPVTGDALRNNKKVDNSNIDEIPPVVVKEVAERTKQHAKEENVSSESLSKIEQSSLLQSSSQSCSSIEWVLGSRNRVLLTTMRPTKKRKLLGETAGLERLIVAQPCEGSSSLCHVCSMGETGDQLNQLVICKSCSVVVHQKCYGVQGEIDGSWLCYWCKHKIDYGGGQVLGSSDSPCALCPKSGGALKPFHREGGGSGGSVEFAHLFCAQWKPEVYIDDTRLMEPLLSVGGVKDARGKMVCNLCKVKLGSCIRCSDGACRSSFHPICARDARNKLEIWGKFGCDDIEMRAFCAKHSGGSCDARGDALERNEQNYDSIADSPAASNRTEKLLVNKIKKLKIACKSGDKLSFHIGAMDAKSSDLGEPDLQEMRLKAAKSNTKHEAGLSDVQELRDMPTLERNSSEDVKALHLDLGLVLKKLIDRGKVSVEQIASASGVSTDSLASRLADNHLGSELNCKILKWLTDNSYMDTSQKDLICNIRCLSPSKVELERYDSSDARAVRDLDMSNVVPVKSVPPMRRAVGNVNIVNENEVLSLPNDKLSNGVSDNEETKEKHVNVEHDNSCEGSSIDGIEKITVETTTFEDPQAEPSPSESALLKSNSLGDVGCNGAEGTSPSKSSVLDLAQETHCSSKITANHYDGNIVRGTDSFIHPYIQKKFEEVQSWLTSRAPPDLNGWGEQKISSREQFLIADACSDDIKLQACVGESEVSSELNLDNLQKAGEMGVLDLCPENEVEGEIVFFQQMLLAKAVTLKYRCDRLIRNTVRDLPHEIDSVRKRRWYDVLVNQYIYELKEARKQGRKERRHKEAQAVLAAATAAAAASSRISSLRKDAAEESPSQENQLKVEASRVRGGLSSIPVPRVKEANLSLGVPKAMLDRYSDLFQFTSGSPKEHPRSCDICSRFENLLNPILVCSSCKVAVHLNCYRSVKESTGPWYCEVCEERAAVANYWEKPFPIAECGLCGAPNGAFRKSSNGQLVHAFCAEWVFDSTFRRGQVYPVEGMETAPRGNDICCVCHRRYGVCIKCNYGNCQATFHPSCARSVGYYMSAKNVGGGKIQHKAYCSKHSVEQRAKADTQKHSAEDLKILKQYRVELEKLRLLCERIVKREKLKRELALCAHDILASRRDSLAFSMVVHRPFLSHEVSSESATTSLKGIVDCSRSCSEALQKSDDITVDSAISVKHYGRVPFSLDNDQKTDDSSTSQHLPTPKPTDSVSFAGKKIPIRAAMACRKFSQSGEKRLKSRKHTETFEKELVMTSDQASMRNRRLPKGYFYVPVNCLSDAKEVSRGSDETEELDG